MVGPAAGSEHLQTRQADALLSFRSGHGAPLPANMTRLVRPPRRILVSPRSPPRLHRDGRPQTRQGQRAVSFVRVFSPRTSCLNSSTSATPSHRVRSCACAGAGNLPARRCRRSAPPAAPRAPAPALRPARPAGRRQSASGLILTRCSGAPARSGPRCPGSGQRAELGGNGRVVAKPDDMCGRPRASGIAPYGGAASC